MIIGSAFLGGCKKQANTVSTKNKQVTITFWNGFTSSDGEVLKGIVKDFNKTNNSNIKIKMDIMTWDNLNEKLPPAITSKTAPDMVAMNYSDLAQYAKNDAVQNLRDYWQYPGVSKGSYTDASIKLGQINGKQYFIPMQVQSMYMFYNKDVFSKANVSQDNVPKTWSELVKIAPKLKKAGSNVSGFTIGTDMTPILYNWMMANGGRLVNSSYTKSEINSAANLKTLTQIRNVIYKHKAGPSSVSGTELDNLMNSGQMGIEINGPWLNAGLKANQINYGVSTLPVGNVKKTAILDGIGFAIPKGTNHEKKEAIYQFIKYWNTKKVATQWSEKNGYPPYLKSVIKSKSINTNPVLNTLTKQTAYAQPYLPGFDKLSEINRDIVNPMLEQLMVGANPKKLLVTANKQINQVLATGE